MKARESQWSLTFEVRKSTTELANAQMSDSNVAMEPDL